MIQTTKDFDGTHDLIIEAYKGQLVTVAGSSDSPKRMGEMDDLGIIDGGVVLVKDGIIVAVGESEEMFNELQRRGVKVEMDKYIGFKARPRVVLPGFIDAHTHLVFAGSRAHEYEAKIKGETYESQHDKGKGLFYTVNLTRQAHEAELFYKSKRVLEQMLEHGTTTVEIKSGYGLDCENEMKILGVVKLLSAAPEMNPLWKEMTIISTFLGAHAIPLEFKSRRTEYVGLVMSVLPIIMEEGLAEFCDIFCDPLAFTVEESQLILKEAQKLGFKLKAHLGQNRDWEKTGKFDAHRLVNELPLVSADHMDYANLNKITGDKSFVAVLLPGVTYHLMEMQEANKLFWSSHAQRFINKGFAVALATDYNPGSCPCFSMQTIMELAARLYRMTPAQIINAVTINAAHAVDRAHEIGSIEVGKKADIIVCDVSDHRELINSFGTNKVWKVIKNGKIVKK